MKSDLNNEFTFAANLKSETLGQSHDAGPDDSVHNRPVSIFHRSMFLHVSDFEAVA